MKRNIKCTLGFALCAVTLVVGLLAIFVQPVQFNPRESLAADLVGVTNGVVFITVTNRSSRLLTVHVAGQSHSRTGGWQTVVSAQFAPLAGGQRQLVKIGLSEGTNGQRVMILCSSTPGSVRQGAFDCCVKLEAKWLIPLFWPQAQEAAILLIKPEHEGT